MNTKHLRTMLAALLCGGLLAAGGPASAGDRDRDGRGWGPHRHGHHHHYRHDDRGRTVIRERVVIRERPRAYYAPPPVYAPPVVQNYYYGPPPRHYGYGRAPAIVVGVDIPPLVIPLR